MNALSKWPKALLPVPRKRVRVPLDVGMPEEWHEDDERALTWFLQTPTGLKLTQVLYYELYSRALTPGLKSEYAQGVHDGKNAQLGRILSLAADEPSERANSRE